MNNAITSEELQALENLVASMQENAKSILKQSKDTRVIMASILADGTTIFRKKNASNSDIEKIAAKALALLVLIKLKE